MTIGNLLNMTADLDWKESYYNPFGITARFYYTKDLTDLVLNFGFNSEPGKKYVYQSGATQLASLMLDSILIKNGTSLSNFHRHLRPSSTRRCVSLGRRAGGAYLRRHYADCATLPNLTPRLPPDWLLDQPPR